MLLIVIILLFFNMEYRIGVTGVVFGDVMFDEISRFLVGLSIIVVLIGSMASVGLKDKKLTDVGYGIMFGCLVVLFTASRFFIFYFVYEVVVLLLVYIVVNWGYNPERVKSIIYLLVYMIIFSMPMFFVLMVIISINGVSRFLMGVSVSVLAKVIVFLAMMVKIPIYTLHF